MLNNIPTLHCADNSDSICLPDVGITPAAVFIKLKKHNPTKSDGTDRIPPRVLLELRKFLYIPMTIFFNNPTNNGFIPFEWKNAKITALKENALRVILQMIYQ